MAARPGEASLRALALAARHGGLVLHPSYRGGWWTYPGCPVERRWKTRYDPPATRVSPATVRSLVGLGLLAASGEGRLAVTPEGEAALARAVAAAGSRARSATVAFPSAARVFHADGTVSYAGIVRAGEAYDGGTEPEVHVALDPFLHPSAASAMLQVAGPREDVVSDAPGAPRVPRAGPCLSPAVVCHAGGRDLSAAAEDLLPVVVEARWQGEDGPGASWWVGLAHPHLGLLFEGADGPAAPTDAVRGLFRPDADLPGVPVTGQAWEASWVAAGLASLDVPPDVAQYIAMAGRDEPSPTMLKALRLASEGGLVRFRGGFWSYPDCPTRKEMLGGPQPCDVPERYVDIRTVDACVRRGLLARGGPAYDAPAALTGAGADLVPSDTAPPGP